MSKNTKRSSIESMYEFKMFHSLPDKILTIEEEKELSDIITNKKLPEEQRQNAALKLVEYNFKFLVMECMKFSRQHGCDVNDVIQYCYKHFYTSAMKYNWRKGAKFITYAKYYIVLAFNNYMSSNMLIKVPRGKIDRDLKIAKNRAKELENRKKDGIPVDEEDFFVPLHKTISMVSIHEKITNDTDEEKEIFIPADDKDLVTNKMMEEEDKNYIMKVFDMLKDERAKEIIREMVLNSEKTVTLNEMGKKLHLSRERARQIKSEALVMMREKLSEIYPELVEIKTRTQNKKLNHRENYVRTFYNVHGLKKRGHCISVMTDQDIIDGKAAMPNPRRKRKIF